MGDEPTDLVAWRKKVADGTTVTTKRARKYHHIRCLPLCSVELDEHERTAICEKCGKSWDAFQWLLEFSDHCANTYRWLVQLTHEKADMEKQRDALKQEVQNLKAQRKRATPSNVRPMRTGAP